MLLAVFVLPSCFYFILFIYLFATPHACGILVPRPGIEPMRPALEAWSLNHWPAREVPVFIFIKEIQF